jgi:hypothetical protein
VSDVSAASGRRGDQFDPKKKLPIGEFHARFQVSGFKVGCSFFKVQGSMLDVRCSFFKVQGLMLDDQS